jgi:adenylate cyclase
MAAEGSNQPPPHFGTNPSPRAEAIRQHLEKILASLQFVNSPNLQNFLRFIVEKTLAGESADIKGYTVATHVLGRKVDFDPNLDPIVRIQAGRLRRALEQYYRVQGKSDVVIIDVPKGSYVPVFRAVSGQQGAGLVIPEVRRESILSLPSGPSVAVMPLLNLTGDHKQEYFTEGLAEELTSELARYQELRVIAYHSTRRWKGMKIDPRAAGEDLGVRFLVEGSIRKDAKTVKIDLHVVDTQNGMRVWGEQYQSELKATTLIALQENIARQVAAKIGSEYGIIPQTLFKESRNKPPESLETYEAFLRHYYYVTVLTPEAFIHTFRVLEEAVAREPESGLSWSLLADLYCHNYTLQLFPLETPLERALDFAKKGVFLEPLNQLGRVVLTTCYFHSHEKELFLQEAEKAMALNPNSPAIIGYIGWLLALCGEWERGLDILQQGIRLNPHYPGWFHLAPYLNLYRQERYVEAYREAQQFQMPQLFWDPLMRAAALGRLGREQEGAQALAELIHLRPDFPAAAPFLISCYAKFPYLIKSLLEGLRLAGLKT